MNLLETIMSAQNGQVVKQLAESNGLDLDQTLKALSGLIPGVASRLQSNAREAGSLENILAALQTGDHRKYLEQGSIAQGSDAHIDGNAILGHILGSKNASRELAANVSGQTGLDSSLLKKLLPVVATLVMGALSKQSQSGGTLDNLLSGVLGGNKPQATPEKRNLLATFLDTDCDGSCVDDIMRLAGKYLF